MRCEWRGEFANVELNELHAEAFGTQVFSDEEWDWRALTSRYSLGWVTARTGSSLIGFVNVVWDGLVHAWLQDAMVAAAARRQGVGAQLVAVARDAARTSGCEVLHVDFDDDLRPFYIDACGFRPISAGLIDLSDGAEESVQSPPIGARDVASRPVTSTSVADKPLGFWAVKAGDAIVARTQGALRDLGVAQPEWWVLHQLELHPGGRMRSELVELLGHNDTPEAIESAIESTMAKNWATVRDDLVERTSLGRQTFERAADAQRRLHAERMKGITDDEFVTTITVLQRVIANVGGDAWHW